MKLIEWLNGLPEVNEVLARDFAGRLIIDSNLSEWKSGGFLEWQAQQRIVASLQDLKADGEELAGITDGVADNMEAMVLARYAAVVHGSTGAPSAATEAEIKCLSKSLRDLMRYRKCQHSAERTDIERKRLELAERKAAQRGKTGGAAEDSNEESVLSHQEKADILKELIFKDLQ